MKIWNIHIEAVMSKKDLDRWKNWSERDVVADTIEEAIKKALAFENKTYDFVATRVREAKFVLEVDVE